MTYPIEEDYEDFELIILSLKCQATDSNCLLNNEILLLQKRKSTTEILINKETQSLDSPKLDLRKYEKDDISYISSSESEDRSDENLLLDGLSYLDEDNGSTEENKQETEENSENVKIDLTSIENQEFADREEFKKEILDWCNLKKLKPIFKT